MIKTVRKTILPTLGQCNLCQHMLLQNQGLEENIFCLKEESHVTPNYIQEAREHDKHDAADS